MRRARSVLSLGSENDGPKRQASRVSPPRRTLSEHLGMAMWSVWLGLWVAVLAVLFLPGWAEILVGVATAAWALFDFNRNAPPYLG